MRDIKIYLSKCANNKSKIIFAIFCLLCETFLAFKLPFLMEEIMELLFNINKVNLPFFFDKLLIYLTIILAQGLNSFCLNLIFKAIGINIVELMTMELMKKVYYLKIKSVSSISISDLYQTINGDVFNLSEMGIRIACQVVQTVIHIIGLLYYMFLTNKLLTAFIIMNFAMVMLIQRKINLIIEKKIIKQKNNAGEYLYESNTFLKNHITYRYIKSYNYFLKRIYGRIKNYLKESYKIEQTVSVNMLLSCFAALINIAIVLGFGGYMFVYSNLSIGIIMTFSMLSGTFGNYINSIPGIFKSIKEFKISLKRVSKIYELECFEQCTESDLLIEKINNIELENVKFSYNIGTDILKNIFMQFSYGNIYCVKGKNGAGKTTLINLILGDIPIDSGRILLNEKELKLSNFFMQLEKHITYCPSNNVLFSDTIQNNIVLSNRINSRKLKILTDIINKEDDIDLELEKKYNPMNDNLSEGQKQRIFIARSLYEDREVLIFDEIENHLDKNVKNEIMIYLNKIKRNKIIIMISHDQLIIDYCDCILDLPSI